MFTGEKFGSFLKETAQTIITALILTFFIYYFIATPNQVKGASMLPNVHDNELILTNRMKHLVGSTILGEKFNINYNRGEIVIFKIPGYEAYIKRIIAMPGDKVEIVEEGVLVNDRLVDEEYIPDDFETRPGDFLRKNSPKIVPDNSYMVMGDNRENSLDSRYQSVGFVPREYIIGPAAFRVLPLSSFGIIPKGEYTEANVE